MIKDVEIIKLPKFNDERGWLSEFFRSDQTAHSPAMGYISSTEPEVVRGPHEHTGQADMFVFLGPGKFRLYLWENREGFENYRKLETHEVGEGNPVSVVVPAGVVHAYKCISENSGLVINLPDKLYKGREKQDEVDEVRWEMVENSPFIITN